MKSDWREAVDQLGGLYGDPKARVKVGWEVMSRVVREDLVAGVVWVTESSGNRVGEGHR